MECNIESYLNIKNTIYQQVGYNFFSSTNHKWSHDIIIIPPASDGWSLWPFGYRNWCMEVSE